VKNLIIDIISKYIYNLDSLDYYRGDDNMSWQLQEAKNKFSQVVNSAINDGPQEITKQGKKSVVILSIKDYQRLKRNKTSLKEFFQKSPLRGLSFERSKDLPRSIDL